ncbi:hypothetical protein GCM10009431_07790 [Gaetbulibacter jejuensis]|uniref:Uncharacterized protein n=1 Tax=Gaetbulibacter jejuensis TaxID=584607 RepID=A0ABN1JG68_9FLAO
MKMCRHNIIFYINLVYFSIRSTKFEENELSLLIDNFGEEFKKSPKYGDFIFKYMLFFRLDLF